MEIFELIAAGDGEGARSLLARDPAQAAAHDAQGLSALLRAAFSGQHDAARILIERGTDVHAVSRNELAVQPLQSAVAAGERELAHLLLDADAVPDERNLAAAEQDGDTAMATLLREYGAESD